MGIQLDPIFDKMKRATIKTIRVMRIPVLIPKIGTVIDRPSYYPELPRKSKSEMWVDNVRWILRHKELNSFYISYGMDVKGLRNEADYLSNVEFIDLRQAGNMRYVQTFYGRYNYIVLLRDKYLFSAYLAGTIGKKCVAETLALIDKGAVYSTESNTWISFEEFCRTNQTAVFKVLDGTFGDGVELLTISDGKLYSGNVEYAVSAYEEKLKNTRVLVQKQVIQHPMLQAFGTKCVNTIRAITFKGKSGKISMFAAFLRVGTDTSSFVDNRAKGGLAIGVDLENGKLMRYALPHAQFGTMLEVHPLSGIQFDGYQLPYWKETVELVSNAHKQFYDMQTIGWDVVLTENGPILLEGNDSWEIGGPQDTYGGLRKRWHELAET